MTFGGYSEDQLIANARDHAFQGLVFATVLRDNKPVKAVLHAHFTEILKAIDGHPPSERDTVLGKMAAIVYTANKAGREELTDAEEAEFNRLSHELEARRET